MGIDETAALQRRPAKNWKPNLQSIVTSKFLCLRRPLCTFLCAVHSCNLAILDSCAYA